MTQTHTPIGSAPIDLDELDSFPPGTTCLNSGRRYTRLDDGRWQWNTNYYTTPQFRPETMIVETYPAGVEVVPRPPETLEQYKWRFRDYALVSARNHSVSYEASRDVLDSLGTNLPLGRGVKVGDEGTWQSLPEGSMVFSGSPENPNLFSVMVKEDRRWVTKIGPGTIDNRVTVYRIGDNNSVEPPEWLTSVSTDAQAEAEKIAQFKAEVWRLGWKLKKAQGWCSTYEHILQSFGITRNAIQVGVNGIRIGQRVAPEVAASLPLGSVLKWTSRDDDSVWGLYVRASSASNVAGTVKIAGTEGCGDRNYRSSMMVLSIPVEERTWRLDGTTAEIAAIMDALPPGITFSNVDEGSPEYKKCRDGRYNGRRDDDLNGRWSLIDFGNPPTITIHTYPGVTL